MDTKVKTLLLNILAHQLEGIMLHYDLMNNYRLMGDCRLSATHRRMMREESKCHAETSLKIIDNFHEIVVPNIRNRVVIPSPDKYLTVWKEWEESTIALYDEAVKAIPDCKLFSYLKSKAEHELIRVKRLIANSR